MTGNTVLQIEELEARLIWSGTYEIFSQTINTGCTIYLQAKIFSEDPDVWTLNSPAEVPLFSAPTIKEVLVHYARRNK